MIDQSTFWAWFILRLMIAKIKMSGSQILLKGQYLSLLIFPCIFFVGCRHDLGHLCTSNSFISKEVSSTCLIKLEIVSSKYHRGIDWLLLNLLLLYLFPIKLLLERSNIRTKLKVRFPQLSSIKLWLLEVINSIMRIMCREVFLSHWLILRHIFSIGKILSPHFLFSIMLLLLLHPFWFGVNFLFTQKGLLICSLISCRVVAKFKMRFPKIVFNLLVKISTFKLIVLVRIKWSSMGSFIEELSRPPDIEVRHLDKAWDLLILFNLVCLNIEFSKMIMRKWFRWKL